MAPRARDCPFSASALVISITRSTNSVNGSSVVVLLMLSSALAFGAASVLRHVSQPSSISSGDDHQPDESPSDEFDPVPSQLPLVQPNVREVNPQEPPGRHGQA